jgi:hypothetical protein
MITAIARHPPYTPLVSVHISRVEVVILIHITTEVLHAFAGKCIKCRRQHSAISGAALSVAITVTRRSVARVPWSASYCTYNVSYLLHL